MYANDIFGGFTMKKLLALILAALMVATFAACSKDEEEGEDLKDYLQNDEVVNTITNEKGETFNFDMIDSETVVITKYECGDDKHALVIPETLDGKTVVAIGEAAFRTCNAITSVTFPATVEAIGNYAFEGCQLLTEITFPATIKSIGKNAFGGCTGLTSVSFAEGSTVSMIENFTFQGCTALTTVTIPAHVKIVKQGAFIGCSALATITVAEGVETIEAQAFQNCKALATLTIPASVTTIGAQAFSGSENLYVEGVTYPAGSAAETYFSQPDYALTEKPVEDDETAGDEGDAQA